MYIKQMRLLGYRKTKKPSPRVHQASHAVFLHENGFRWSATHLESQADGPSGQMLHFSQRCPYWRASCRTANAYCRNTRNMIIIESFFFPFKCITRLGVFAGVLWVMPFQGLWYPVSAAGLFALCFFTLYVLLLLCLLTCTQLHSTHRLRGKMSDMLHASVRCYVKLIGAIWL